MDRHARAALRRELAHAEDERERLGVVIAYLRDRLKEADQEAPAEPPQASTNGAGPYAGMTSSRATEHLLESRGKPMKTTDIFDVITAGGVKLRDSDGLYKTLNRNPKFERISRGLWGLTKWRSSRQEALVG
jgi:hypothetical protein